MTVQELAQEIQALRAYLDARRIDRRDNPRVVRVASFNKGIYTLYRYAGKKRGFIVKALGDAYKATSKANAEQVIAKQERLYSLLRAAEVNDWD